MTPLFKKLNFKNQKEVLVLNAPESFEAELSSMRKFAAIKTSVEEVKDIEFVMVFATKQTEVDSSAKAIAPKLKGDAVVWYVYPKGTSKKYKCEFNRDIGWQILGSLGLEGVRMVAVDQDWSALRFRKVEFIKTMTRSFAMTPQGKEKSKKK
jgi:hypothetical protein